MKVSEVMIEDVGVCRPEESLARAAQIMWERDCGSVPIVDGSRRPIGMITDRDICMSAYLRGRALGEVGLHEVMSRDVKTCNAGDELDRTHRLLREHRIRRLPVVDDDGSLVGILSLNDLVRCTGADVASRGEGKAAEDLVATLAAVGRARSAEPDVVQPRARRARGPAPSPRKGERSPRKGTRTGGA